MRAILLLALSLSLCGCAPIIPNLTQDQIDHLDYGVPLTIDYQKAIKDYFNSRLLDPYSAVYEFGTPITYWMNGTSPTLVGYMVKVNLNAKNAMGGYIGIQEYGFLFRDNQILYVLPPDGVWDREAIHHD